MSPELAAIRQEWYDNIQPGMLVRYDEWAVARRMKDGELEHLVVGDGLVGYTNKPALVVAVHTNVPKGRRGHIEYVILVDEVKKTVYQYLISPFDGWSSI